jgi:hypothetical protein
MTVFEAKEAVYAALKNIGVPVYHIQAPAKVYDRCPYLVYSVVSNVPALEGDNIELYARVTFRIHIVTSDGAYKTLYQEVCAAMRGLGFFRVQTNEQREDKIFYAIADFRIGVES